MATDLLSYAGWYFLPNLVTGYAQTILYTIFIRAGEPKPQPGSPRFIRDRKRIHVAVILIYLLYTVYEADWQLRRAGDFYSLLGVAHDSGEKAINSKFRRLTLQYHPDKVTTTTPETESLYLSIQTARDTLVDPAKRFAYDRFGPDILTWRQCKKLQDFVFHGVQQTSVYYTVSFCVLILLGMLGYLQTGRFWRYWVMTGLFCVEMSIMMQPTWPAFLSSFLNPVLMATGIRTPYLPFQLILLLRKLSVTFFIAMNQLSPHLNSPSDPSTTAKTTDGGISPQLLDRLEILSKSADAEVSRLMGLELTPFLGERHRMRELKSGLKEWLVQNTIRNDPEVKAAIGKTLGRRRRDGVNLGMSASADGEDMPPPVPQHLE